MYWKLIFLVFFCVIFRTVPGLVDVNLDQSVENSGFHRLLITNITLYGNLTSCKLLLEEKFPKNVFIPENVIDHINEYSNIIVELSQKLNVESIASASTPFSAYIFLNKSQPVSTSNEFHTTYLYSVPLRVRYHDPKSGGGVREFKKLPVIFYGRCPPGLSLPKGSIHKLPCDPYSSDVCEWTTLSFTQKNLLPTLLIPVGNTDDYQYVFISTHIVSYIGLLYLLSVLFLVK